MSSLRCQSFKLTPAVWDAFKRRCEREGLVPAAQVRELVTAWAIEGDPDWTP